MPETMCQIPHQAAINAIPPICKSAGKIFGLKISTKAKPEFWIPVSILIVLRSFGFNLKILAKK